MHGVQCGILRLLRGRNGVHFLPRVNQRRRDELRNKRYLRRGHVHGRLDLRLVPCRDVLGRRRGKLHELRYWNDVKRGRIGLLVNYRFKLRRWYFLVWFDLRVLCLGQLLGGERIKLHDVPRRHFQWLRRYVIVLELQPRHVSGPKWGYDMRSVPSWFCSADE